MESSVLDVKTVLRIPKDLRNHFHIDCLQRLTQDVQFFVRITSEQNTSQVHRECCKVMSLEEYSADDFIFHFGDKGEKFYIILSGSVSVKVPAKRRVVVTKFAVNRIEKFLHDSQQKGDSSEEELTELPVIKREGHVTVNVSEVISALKDQNSPNKDLNSRTAILSNEEKHLLGLFKHKVREEQRILMNAVKHSETDNLEIEFDDFNEIGILFAGGAFGELALISDRPRSATIQARERSSFLVLSKSDFTRILGDIAEKRMSSIVNFLQKVPFFISRSRASLIRMAYYFQTKSFRKNRVIYKEFDPVDGIYLIREGEVTITKRKTISNSSPSVFQSTPSDFLSRKSKKSVENIEVKLVIKANFESFGGFEIIEHQSSRSYSCKCTSINCELLYMPKSSFLSRVPHLDLFKNLILEDHQRLLARFDESFSPCVSFESFSPLRSRTPGMNKDQSLFITPVYRSLKMRTNSISQRSKNMINKQSPFRVMTKKEVSEAVNGRNSIMKKYGNRLSVNSSFSALPNRLKTAASFRVIKK